MEQQPDTNILQQIAHLADQCGLEYEDALLILRRFQVKRGDGINHLRLARYLRYYSQPTPRQKFAQALIGLPLNKRLELIRGAE